ncbi:EAL domain-containing protein [Rhizobium sp.]|uniref:putative bifunctional diguanylate cyclase/phosphodiesterase n=1 Tax=Rhizobium sp. TaxID=391 RepID=UPI000E880517|nr:diguanylate cyclase [Rhizobium sp.]
MLITLQNTILERIAKGEALAETLDFLCRSVEVIVPDVVISVLTLDDRGRLNHLAGPSIPKHYADAIDGVRIGEDVGSCGTAAHRATPVLVDDIETHPFWEPFKDLAMGLGFRACWSTPIISDGAVLGTFAFYFYRKRGPSEFEQGIVDACVYLCAIGLDRELRAKERRRVAYTDSLTGLPNRSRFNEVVALEETRNSKWGLLLMDLDNLKLVNDTFGHQAGDDLIQVVGQRLAAISDGDSAFRLGGDEFAIIVRGTECVDLGFYAGHVLDSLKAPCFCAGQTVYPSGTIGGAVAMAGETAGNVRQNADFALYEAKERCRGRFIEYSGSAFSVIERRFRAFQQVSEALRENRIDVYYQPIVDFETGQIVGLEALCRLITRGGDVVTASEFHSVTNDVKLAAELTSRVLDIVARDARDWIDRGLYFGRIGLNVSAGDFLEGRLTQKVLGVLNKAGVPADRIVIELTESIYIGRHEQSVVGQIAALREAGMAVALDDFGTGFASLTHLLTVPLDIIKIDRLFVERMMNDNSAAVIVEALVSISRKLGFLVIAEGIETQAQSDFLAGLGCARGQGFLFSKGIDRHEISALLLQQLRLPAPIVAHAFAH